MEQKRNCQIIANGVSGEWRLEPPAYIDPVACEFCAKDVKGWLATRELPATEEIRKAFTLGAEKQFNDFGKWLNNTDLIRRVKEAEAKVKACEANTAQATPPKVKAESPAPALDRQKVILAAAKFAVNIYPVYRFAAMWQEKDEVLDLEEVLETLMGLYDDLVGDPTCFSVETECFYCEWLDDEGTIRFGFTLSEPIPADNVEV